MNGIMLPRAVRNPVTSAALRIASREPSGENNRREPLGEVFDEVGEVSKETILIEDMEEVNIIAQITTVYFIQKTNLLLHTGR